MSSKHTPGPWAAQKGRTTWHVGTESRGVASIYNYGEEEANARLIAAAPELLSALCAMLTHMGMDEDEWNKPTFDQARAALKAAGGAQQ